MEEWDLVDGFFHRIQNPVDDDEEEENEEEEVDKDDEEV